MTEHPFQLEEEILNWYKTASAMERIIFYRSAQSLVDEYETLKAENEALRDGLMDIHDLARSVRERAGKEWLDD